MTTVTPTVQFTVKMSEFKRKVRATSYALSADKTLPVLGLIRITVEADQLMMVASDRFKLIATRQTLAPVAPVITGEVLMDARATKYLGMMASSPFPPDELTVKLWGDKVEFSTKQETISVAHESKEYPKIETLLSGAFNAEPASWPVAFDPLHLDTVTKSFRSMGTREPLAIQGTAGKQNQGPTLLYGPNIDDWVALLMPVRLGGSQNPGQVAKEAFTRLLGQTQQESA